MLLNCNGAVIPNFYYACLNGYLMIKFLIAKKKYFGAEKVPHASVQIVCRFALFSLRIRFAYADQLFASAILYVCRDYNGYNKGER